MKKICTLFFLVVLCPGINAQSIATWTFENIFSAVPSLPIEASSHSFKVSSASASLSGGNNNGSPDICSGAESWSTNFWPTSSSRSTGSYMEFEARARDGYDLVVSEFSFRANISSASGPRKFQVYCSTDGFRYSNHYLGSGTNSTRSLCKSFSYNLNTQTPSGGTIAFRIYPYEQDPAAQAATMRVDNVTIHGAALLPITLLNWTGEAREGGIWLSWVTASEQNHAYFAIERRTEQTGFEEIDRLPGRGDSQERRDYTFFDPFPAAGLNYYRLRQVDRDGSHTFSEIIAIHYEPGQEIRVYPTLADASLKIDLRAMEASPAVIRIRNLNGRQLLERQIAEPYRIQQLDVSALNEGIYLLVVEMEGERVVRRFLKQ